MWRRLWPWLIVLTASGLGGALGVLSAVWLPPLAAAVVGTAGAGVAGIFSARAQEAINRRSISAGRAVRVRDLSDPIILGVHPAAKGRGGTDRVPAFVPRDAYARLRTSLRENGFVLLIGESTAGKSRLAFEAMRAELPDHRFHRPLPGQGFGGVLAAVAEGHRHVVWLDELDLYLGAGGLTVDAVTGLLAERPHRHVVILATMRVREYDRYSARHRDVSDAAVWRAGRDVLLLAGNPLELPREWSAGELSRARAVTTDDRLAKAVRQSNRYGVAEVLAAGPELVADWRRAAAIGDHPRGAALVAAAVDCRRMGVHRPMSLDVLVAMHGTYLDGTANRLRLESVEEAVRWATAVTYASSSLLTEVQNEGYLAFDYLIDQPFLAAVPETNWRTLLADATPAEAYDVGWAAIDLQRADQAIAAFGYARQHHVANADYAYVLAWGNSGQAVAAADHLQAIALDRTARLGADHPDTLQAQHDQARYLGESGQAARAARILRHVAERRAAVLGAAHPLTISAREYEAKFVGRSGDCHDAVRMLTETHEQRRRLFGDTHVDTLLVRINIARYTAKAGRPTEAARQLAELLDEVQTLLGPDSPYSLSVRYEYGRAVGDSGDRHTAIDVLTTLLADQHRVLGRWHPRALSTRHQLARFVGETGDATTAVRLFTELVDDRLRILGPAHARTIGSLLQLARFLAATGDTRRAATMLDETHRRCDDVLGDRHPLSRFAAELRTSLSD